MTAAPRSDRRDLRLPVLVGGTLLLLILVALPVIVLFVRQGDAVDQAQIELAAYRSEIAAQPLLERELARLRHKEGSERSFLPGESTSLAAAGMQGLVKGLIERHAGQLRSAQMLSANPANGLEKIEVQFDLSMPLGSLKAATYELETGYPFLFIDDLEIRPETYASDITGTPSKLHVQWTMHGYRRLVPQ